MLLYKTEAMRYNHYHHHNHHHHHHPDCLGDQLAARVPDAGQPDLQRGHHHHVWILFLINNIWWYFINSLFQFKNMYIYLYFTTLATYATAKNFNAVCCIGTMPRLVQIETWFFGITIVASVLYFMLCWNNSDLLYLETNCQIKLTMCKYKFNFKAMQNYWITSIEKKIRIKKNMWRKNT